MKNSPLLFLLLSGCALMPSQVQRQVAQQSVSDRLQVRISRPMIFANGANTFILNVQLKDDQGNPIKPAKGEIELIHDVPVASIRERSSSNGPEFEIMPKPRSADIRIIARWRDHLSQAVEIKTTIEPQRDSMLPIKSNSNSMNWVSGLTYLSQENFDPGQFEGFSLDNRGPNAIVSADESSRSFEFAFEEHARQNINLMVNDAPNSTVSHTMHSHFMFFPRKVLPFAEISQERTTVTLANGEQLVFKASGEIESGIFTEGPVDTGPDRFKRTYANLKYQGKGVLLRANARGQMPQQGQFENTPIDMEYGIKFSNDVLIINGSTGQRCRRPKKDFWSSADVSPILFKFPTDAEFDAYLMKNCKFGLPEMEVPTRMSKLDGKPEAEKIWESCYDESDFQSCLMESTEDLGDENLRAAVQFEMLLKKELGKREERQKVSDLIHKEKIRLLLLLQKDFSWIKHSDNFSRMREACLDFALSKVELKLRFEDPKELITPALASVCEEITSLVRDQAEAEALPKMKQELEADFSWSKGGIGKALIEACEKKAEATIPSLNHSSHPALYRSAVVKSCSEMEKNPAYIKWLNSQTSVIEARLMSWMLSEVEARAERRAMSCVSQYPVDTQVQRILHKRARENCLLNFWDDIETAVLKDAAQDPQAQAVSLSQMPFYHKLESERRRMQLRIMKKHFLS